MKYPSLLTSALLLALLGSMAVVAEESTVKQDAKKVGQETSEVAHKIGEGGKEVGKKVADTAVTVGHATRDTAKKVGKTVADTAVAVGHATRDGAKQVAASVKNGVNNASASSSSSGHQH